MLKRIFWGALLPLVALSCDRTLAVKDVDPPGIKPLLVEAPDDDKGEVGWYPALRLGPAGQLHIAYCDKTRGDVRYGYRGDDGVLRVETVAAYGAVGKYISLAVDEHNQPHLLYNNQDSKYLMYATRVDGAWLQAPLDAKALAALPAGAERHERVAWGAEVGMGGRLLAHAGRLYAIFYHHNPKGGQLKLATRKPLSEAPYGSANAWSLETVDQADGSWSMTTDLVIDKTELVALYAHWNFIDSELRLARRPLAGGEWKTRVLYPMKKQTPGWMTSLVVQKSGPLLVGFTTMRRETINVGPLPDDDDMVDAPILGYFLNRMRLAQGGNGDLIIAAAETGKGRLGNSIFALYRRHQGQWSRYPVDTRRPTAKQIDLAAGPTGEAIALYYSDGQRNLNLYDETGRTKKIELAPPPSSQPASPPSEQTRPKLAPQKTK